jgi:very-short-patch-repair endonuclease
MKYNPRVVVAWMAERGIKRPVLEHRFHPVRKWRFDFAWPIYYVALEVDGGIWTRGAHGRGTGIARDQEKKNEAASLGWLVLSVQPRQLCTEETARLIMETLSVSGLRYDLRP